MLQEFAFRAAMFANQYTMLIILGVLGLWALYEGVRYVVRRAQAGDPLPGFDWVESIPREAWIIIDRVLSVLLSAGRAISDETVAETAGDLYDRVAAAVPIFGAVVGRQAFIDWVVVVWNEAVDGEEQTKATIMKRSANMSITGQERLAAKLDLPMPPG